MRRLRWFGLKCAIVCSVFCVWGIVQLAIMGILFHARSVAFAEDVPEVHEDLGPRNLSDFYVKLEEGYDANALNCWIGASFYCILLIFFLCQTVMNYWSIEKGSTFSVR